MHPELGFSESEMRKLAERMIRTESQYAKIFLPWVNTFSYQYGDLDSQPDRHAGKPITYTPPMKKDIERTHELERPSVYVMFSGTGSAVEANEALVRAANAAGINAYSPPWEKIEGTEKRLPSLLSDAKMLAVMGRAGWGTGWQALQLELPWLVTPFQQGDDPEIYFNNLTIKALRLGREITGAITSEELTALATDISPGLRNLRDATRERFGTTDGIDYMAEAIFADLNRWK